MFLNGPGREVSVRTKLNFLVQNQLSDVEDFIPVKLSDVVAEGGLWTLSVEEDVDKAVFADLAAPNLAHGELVALTLEQAGLLSQGVLVDSDQLFIA